MNITVKCGWCQRDFQTDNSKLKNGTWGVKVCHNCGRIVRSSRIELTGDVIGAKHQHFALKTGDVV